MSGSKFTAFHDDPWILKLVAFVKGILEEQQRVRVIGICFGHQIVGRALGGVVKSSEDGWEVSVLGVDLSKRGQEIFGRPGLVCDTNFICIFSLHSLYNPSIPQRRLANKTMSGNPPNAPRYSSHPPSELRCRNPWLIVQMCDTRDVRPQEVDYGPGPSRIQRRDNERDM